jgi:N-acetylmuramoyl-L-alanine amidase
LTTKILGVAFALVLAFVSMGSPSASALSTGTAYTTAALNLRSGPGTGYRIYRTIPYGARVYINRYASNSWYRVTYAGTTGYSYGAYLRQGSSGGSTSSGSYTTSGGSSSGYAVANTARSLLGYRYNGDWNADTPAEGFNCVGYTKYVYSRHGRFIGYNLWQQSSAGYGVSRYNLRPGDLVFFANTLSSGQGLSHAAIYLGNNTIAHAEWYNSGVTTDYMGPGSFYGSRFYTARRIF